MAANKVEVRRLFEQFVEISEDSGIDMTLMITFSNGVDTYTIRGDRGQEVHFPTIQAARNWADSAQGDDRGAAAAMKAENRERLLRKQEKLALELAALEA